MTKIMFNDKYGLTEAVLNGKKTQTRRVINLKEGEYVKVVALDNGCFMSYVAKEGNPTAYVGAIEMPNFVRPLEPKYFIGEVVAVAMSYDDIYMEKIAPCAEKYRWNAYNKGWNHKHKGWKNKMFVSAEDMPHHIRITNIRVEKLQDISEDDCMAEGVYYHTEPPKHHEYDRYSPWSPSVKPYKFESEKYFCSAKYAFKHLIEKVSGTGVWESNPYVFVYEFVKED